MIHGAVSILGNKLMCGNVIHIRKIKNRPPGSIGGGNGFTVFAPAAVILVITDLAPGKVFGTEPLNQGAYRIVGDVRLGGLTAVRHRIISAAATAATAAGSKTQTH